MTHNVEIGTFELNGVSGVSIASGSDAAGIRLACPHHSLGLFDGKDVLLAMDQPCSLAPDMSYSRWSWLVPVSPEAVHRFGSLPREGINGANVYHYDDASEAARVTLEWCACDDADGRFVIGRYAVDAPLKVGLFVNGCFAQGSVVKASSHNCELAQGGSLLAVTLDGPVCRPYVIDNRKQAEQVFAGIDCEAGKSMAFYVVSLQPDSPLYFSMRLSEKSASMIPPALDTFSIDRHLAEGAAEYERTRMTSRGAFNGAAEAVGSLAAYSRAYDPKRMRVQTTVNRTWGGANSPGLVFGWDNFFTSYIAAWENPELAAKSLEHIVGVYGERGIAHGPTQRNLIIPIMYCRTLDLIGDTALAERTWDTMMDFMRFWFSDRGDGLPWRDGNRDGLIESGTSDDLHKSSPGILIQNAMDETGYDDIPIYSAGFTENRRAMLADNVDFDWHSRCLTITLIGQNSLYCAACKSMAIWARRLGRVGDAEWLDAESERVQQLIRERLFCADDGIFRDRFWNGNFSPVKAMTVFYPLLAGVADDEVRERLKSMLLDPCQFWGDNLIPTVSRDDPAYCDGLDKHGNYWRGNSWGPTTYIVYLAIKEAGWHDIAAEYARRTVGQFMQYWNEYTHAYENYPPEGDVDHEFLYVQGWGGREIRYVWSAMMVLCGLEEAFGLEVTRPGLRFGNPHLHEEASVQQIQVCGQSVNAVAAPERTYVKFGDEWEFLARPGIVVRGFVINDGLIEFETAADADAEIVISYRRFEASGRCAVTIDTEKHDSEIAAGAVRFKLPAGTHRVSIKAD